MSSAVNRTTRIVGFNEIGKTDLALVGGKGANLGELTKIGDVEVPEGFCVTTEVFKEVVETSAEFGSLLDQLTTLKAEDRGQIGEISAKIRNVIEELDIPADIVSDIVSRLQDSGERSAFAVRSSATAEDLPTASFAGQQDTYLNIIGKESILRHISKCWASLFIDRAVTYRIQNGIDHYNVRLAVIIQKMIFPEAAGIMFTADPVTSNRRVLSIDASFGLGEALVSGKVNPDIYKVLDGEIVDKQISTKTLAIHAAEDGGTIEQEIEPGLQNSQALTDEQILKLGQIGKKIEGHFGSPQDIEWCLAGDPIYIVQSRPITTLFPVPESNDQKHHIYVSVGHQQMMTDPFRPLGLSFWNMTAPAPMPVAAGRPFIDVAPMLTTEASRTALMATLGKSDPLIKDALENLLTRESFMNSVPDEDEFSKGNARLAALVSQPEIENDPAIVSDLIEHSEKELSLLKQIIATKSGAELFDFIPEHMKESGEVFRQSKGLGVVMAGVNAANWINEKMEEWLGEKNAADTLSQSLPDNVTSQMGLELLNVADAIRPYPEVTSYLQDADNENLFAELVKLEGGQQSREAIRAYLEKYGMRCAGEIDITNTRWSERPATLVPLILGNIRNFEPNEAARKFEEGTLEVLKKETDLLDRLKHLPDGKQKAKETKRMIDRIRTFAGYREYPKYAIISRYFVYKQALMREAERLVGAAVINEKEDVYYITFEEFREAVRTNTVDARIINKRKEEYKQFEKLTPPRVMTSDGEVVNGKYNREDLPSGTLVGLAVSSGVVEGRARVIFKMEDAVLKNDDILVTPFTDPSWTPLFVSIKGLVTEVGGLMTHGAVIAREYGLPAVVGVEIATKLIKDGQWIRVNGTDGYVEILET